MRRRGIGWVLALLAGPVVAQDGFTFAILPSSPVPQQPFQVRVAQTPATCAMSHVSLWVAPPSNDVVNVYLDVPDYCRFPTPGPEQFYVAPALPAGIYRFRFYLCSNNTPPTPPCLPHSEQFVLIGGPPQPSVIPATSAPMQWLLVALLAATAGAAARARTEPRRTGARTSN